jgi:glycosyltransferase involved in cell wall biosynthesis/ADP-heptose:LPS heptosyltransferase
MHLVIDLQGAQTESRFRGIGRYSLALCDALIDANTNHTITVVLNGMLSDSVEPLRRHFMARLPNERILVWSALSPSAAHYPVNAWRHRTAQKIREAFIRKLQPDCILLTSLFEGFGDAGITSIGAFDSQTPVAVILYDLIPLSMPDSHYRTDPLLQAFYQEKVSDLKKAGLLLAISQDSKTAAQSLLSYSPSQIHTVGGGVNAIFRPLHLTQAQQNEFCHSLGIQKPFLLYTGGADERKNLRALISAFANLPQELRSQYQLVFAGKIPDSYKEQFHSHAHQNGLSAHSFLQLGYVSDDQLVMLYNTCRVFVFPSLAEGLGIPPLEAMACGAPVLAANTTSLPEIIGLPKALFDPHSVTAMSAKLAEVLTNPSLRTELIEHGSRQVKKFTWQLVAQKTFDALTTITRLTPVDSAALSFQKTSAPSSSPLRILLLKLDHLGDFILAIPALQKLKALYTQAQIDIVVGSWCRPLAEHLQLFNAIYTFDFFKIKSSQAPKISYEELEQLLAQLQPNYDIAIDLRRQRDTRFLLKHIDAQCKVGYQSHDPQIDAHLSICLPAPLDQPFLKTALNTTPMSEQILALIRALDQQTQFRDAAMHSLVTKNHSTPFDVAIFPLAGNSIKEWPVASYRQLIERLIRCPEIANVHVYFANPNECATFSLQATSRVFIYSGLSHSKLIEQLNTQALAIGNNSFGIHLSAYLGLTTIGIYGGHESVQEWGSPFANAFALSAKVPCSPCHLSDRSQCPYELRCLNQISVDAVLDKVLEALDALSKLSVDANNRTITLKQTLSPREIDEELLAALSTELPITISPAEQLIIAKSISFNRPPNSIKRIFIDISELVLRDAKTGIQRVVKSILQEAPRHLSASYQIIPVYATATSAGYRVATQFLAQLGQEAHSYLKDEPILYSAGDIFLGLDLNPQVSLAQQKVFNQMRSKGVLIKFVVYDLLPISHPQFFPEGTTKPFEEWLQLVQQSDEALCISQSTAKALGDFFDATQKNDQTQALIRSFPLGVDFRQPPHNVSSDDFDTDVTQIEAAFRMHPTVLMVGTLEPRKGYGQVLDAFELLWSNNQSLNLLIIGKVGWGLEALIQRIRQHPELNHRLFWFGQLSDHALQIAYQKSSCLLAASEGEGFGLPLIEAAHFQLPIIARDIPVFREVAKNHAYYFAATSPEELARAIQSWLELYKENRHPCSDEIAAVSWEQSTKILMNLVCQNKLLASTPADF